MKKLLYFIFAISALFVHSHLKAQDPSPKLPWIWNYYYNPGYVGLTNSCIETSLTYQRTYLTLPYKFETMFAGVNYSFKSLKNNPGLGGIGLWIAKDCNGPTYTNDYTAALPFAFKVNMNDRLRMQVGLAPEINYRVINLNALIFSDQLDPIKGKLLNASPNFYYDIADQKALPNLSIGMAFQYADRTYNNNYFESMSVDGGVAWNHIKENDFSVTNNGSFDYQTSPLYSKYCGFFQVKIPVHTRWSLSETIINPYFSGEIQGNAKDMNLGINILSNKCLFGASIRKESYKNIDLSTLSFQAGYTYNVEENGDRISIYITYENRMKDNFGSKDNLFETTIVWQHQCEKTKRKAKRFVPSIKQKAKDCKNCDEQTKPKPFKKEKCDNLQTKEQVKIKASK